MSSGHIASNRCLTPQKAPQNQKPAASASGRRAIGSSGRGGGQPWRGSGRSSGGGSPNSVTAYIQEWYRDLGSRLAAAETPLAGLSFLSKGVVSSRQMRRNSTQTCREAAVGRKAAA